MEPTPDPPPRYGNCVSYALARWRQEGGYLIIRRSRWYPGPHVLWSPDLIRFEAYVPVYMRRWARKRLIPPMWFRGRVKQWEGKEEK